MKTDFLTPVGRLVQGNPFEAQTTNMQGAPLVVQSGPNAGQPTQRYYIGVAFSKTDQAFAAFYAKLVEVAKASFPTLFNAQGQCTHPRFSWKLIDGDGIDDNGKPNSQKEGFAGHWVVKFQSSFPPRCFHAGHYQPHEQIQDKNSIQRGYFVRVAGTIEGNNNPQKPGLYVNLGMVELAAVGPVIVSGPDAAAVFGQAPASLPAGAQALPMPGGSAPSAAPFMPGTPAPAAAPLPAPAMPAPAGSPAAMMPSPAPVAVAPNPGILAGPGGIPAVPGMPAPTLPAAAPMAPPAAPTAPAYVMTAKAGGFTRDQYVAQGWTDEQLRAQGMMQ